MLLRRISSAIRRQDWFTVLIEICVVVIGLLIGLQINNWNEARADRSKEAAFLARMTVDVDRAREQMKDFVAAREQRLRSIAKVENMYYGDGEIVPVSELACTEFASMHMITHPPIAVPSITEAFEGGRIDLLSEATLIQALIAVEQSEDRLRTVIDTISLNSPDLSEKYPDAVSWGRATEINTDDFGTVFASDGYRMAARCHFLEAMPETSFLTDTVRGLQANQWYVSFLNRHLDRLDELAAALKGTPIIETSQMETD